MIGRKSYMSNLHNSFISNNIEMTIQLNNHLSDTTDANRDDE